jgi:hypothetical protein
MHGAIRMIPGKLIVIAPVVVPLAAETVVAVVPTVVVPVAIVPGVAIAVVIVLGVVILVAVAIASVIPIPIAITVTVPIPVSVAVTVAIAIPVTFAVLVGEIALVILDVALEVGAVAGEPLLILTDLTPVFADVAQRAMLGEVALQIGTVARQALFV